MERAGDLQPGDLIDELQLFFQTLERNISDQMKDIRVRAKALDLV
jgi:hypothetical protein